MVTEPAWCAMPVISMLAPGSEDALRPAGSPLTVHCAWDLAGLLRPLRFTDGGATSSTHSRPGDPLAAWLAAAAGRAVGWRGATATPPPLQATIREVARHGGFLGRKREVIVTGDELTSATSATSTEGPAVSIKLDARGADSMLRTTRLNVGKPMAVVYIEKSRRQVEVNGQKVDRDSTSEKVINVATIRGVFGPQFQVTGLSSGEARDLSLMLRSGSLAAPVEVVEERAIGPSLGQDNIDKGVRALEIGILAVFVFMAIYYRAFGLVADAVLLANVILLTALLSMLRASLSLPGIAGIILTVGIAVDANVLIYERIREELRNGVSPQAAIRAGFDKAFSAIADSNVTALIAGLALWVIGTGAIRGFAIVLTLGIATSMFTSLLGSRALITLLYGGRQKVARLSIG